MILFPAVDIKNGECVRLAQGKEDQVTVFASDPVRRLVTGLNSVPAICMSRSRRRIFRDAQEFRTDQEHLFCY